MRGPNPDKLPEIANQLIVHFQNWQAKQTQLELDKTNEFINGRISLVALELSKKNELLEYFLETKGLRILDDGEKEKTGDLSTIIEQYFTTQQTLKGFEENPKNKNLKELAHKLEEGHEEIKPWLGELYSLELQRAHDLSQYLALQSHPNVNQIEPAIEAIRNRIFQTCMNGPKTDEETCQNLSFYLVARQRYNALTTYKEQIMKSRWEIQSNFLPKELFEKERLEKKIKLLEERLVMLREEKGLNASVRAKEHLKLIIISPACSLSTYKISNRRLVLLFGAIGVLCATISIVVLFEILLYAEKDI